MSLESTTPQVFIVGFWPDYETLFLQTVEYENSVIQIFNPELHYSRFTKLQYLPKVVRNGLYTSSIKKLINGHPDAIFIFQDSRLILECLEKNISDRCCILMRNICNPNSKTGKSVLRLQNKGVRSFSFDQADCEKYGFHFYNQFIESVITTNQPNPSYDFCFTGMDKGRGALLEQIKQETESRGFKTCIDIRHSKRAKAIQMSKKKGISSYLEYLNNQLDCRCIIDINQSSQTGLTMRPLEAVLYKKKLLTNNQSVVDQPYYNPNNIFVFKHAIDYSALTSFMETPFEINPPEITGQHQTNRVLNNIIALSKTQYEEIT